MRGQAEQRAHGSMQGVETDRALLHVLSACIDASLCPRPPGSGSGSIVLVASASNPLMVASSAAPSGKLSKYPFG